MKKIGLSVTTNVESAWDACFGHQVSKYIKVTLKNGKVFYGYLGDDSVISSNQNERDIYIDELWTLDEDKEWQEIKPKESILINANEISTVKFVPSGDVGKEENVEKIELWSYQIGQFRISRIQTNK